MFDEDLSARLFVHSHCLFKRPVQTNKEECLYFETYVKRRSYTCNWLVTEKGWRCPQELKDKCASNIQSQNMEQSSSKIFKEGSEGYRTENLRTVWMYITINSRYLEFDIEPTLEKKDGLVQLHIDFEIFEETLARMAAWWKVLMDNDTLHSIEQIKLISTSIAYKLLIKTNYCLFSSNLKAFIYQNKW